MLKNDQTYFKIFQCSHSKIFKVCLTTFQHCMTKKQTQQKNQINQYFPKFTAMTLAEHPSRLIESSMPLMESLIP